MEKNSEEFTKYYRVDKMKLTDYLTYESEFDHASKHYANSGISVPRLLYYVDEITSKVNTVVEWNGTTNLLVPPFIDYVLYKTDNDSKIVLAKEFNEALRKYMDNIQSFMPGTKIITEKKIVKCQKAMNKYKFTMIIKKFKIVNQTALID